MRAKIQIPNEFKPLFEDGWRNIVLYGGRSSGKSYDVAISQLLRGRSGKLKFLNCREFQNSISDSVYSLLVSIIEEYGWTDFRWTRDSIYNTRTGSEWIFKGIRNNPESIKSIPNIDEAWVEEAQTISDSSIKTLKNTVRKDGSRLVFTFNRLTENDPVFVEYVKKPKAKTYVKKVNFDVLDKYGLFPEVMRLEMEDDKKNNAQLFPHIWLGEPINQTENSILGRQSILDAMERKVNDEGAIEIGVDVARLGDDRSVFWKRKGLKTIETRVFEKKRTNELRDELEVFAGFNKDIRIKIDDTGVGGGLTDQMLELGYNVIPINFAQASSDPDKYPNWISEAWFHLQSVIDEIQLPDNENLLQELSTRLWKMDNKGRRAVESKSDYKKRSGFRSPDFADACILCYYVVPEIQKVEYGGVF